MPTDAVPTLCQCGCGQPAKLAPKTVTKRGIIRGQPLRYLHGHHGRVQWGDATIRFWRSIRKEPETGCWIWIGDKSDNGYGRIHIDRFRRIGAHRASWELCRGPIPDGLFVLHNCPGGDNRACVNPDHLFLGTQADNVRDMKDKGRALIGVKNPQTKVTPEQVWAMRSLYPLFSGQTIAVMMGLSYSHVYRILRQERWKSLDIDPSHIAPEFGATSRGSRNSSAKLNEAQVIEIRALAHKARYSILAQRYGVTETTICHIVSRKTWIHI